MNKTYTCNSGGNFVTRRKLCLTRPYKFFCGICMKKEFSSQLKKTAFVLKQMAAVTSAALQTAGFFDTV